MVTSPQKNAFAAYPNYRTPRKVQNQIGKKSHDAASVGRWYYVQDDIPRSKKYENALLNIITHPDMLFSKTANYFPVFFGFQNEFA